MSPFSVTSHPAWCPPHWSRALFWARHWAHDVSAPAALRRGLHPSHGRGPAGLRLTGLSLFTGDPAQPLCEQRTPGGVPVPVHTGSLHRMRRRSGLGGDGPGDLCSPLAHQRRCPCSSGGLWGPGCSSRPNLPLCRKSPGRAGGQVRAGPRTRCWFLRESA